MAARKAKDLPITYKALDHVRSEFHNEIASVKLEMKAGFKKVDARFNQVDARFNQVDARFNLIDARFDKLESQLEKMNATNARMLAIYEEQNSRNKASFEGSEFIKDQQENLTKRVEALEAFRDDIKTRLKSN